MGVQCYTLLNFMPHPTIIYYITKKITQSLQFIVTEEMDDNAIVDFWFEKSNPHLSSNEYKDLNYLIAKYQLQFIKYSKW